MGPVLYSLGLIAVAGTVGYYGLTQLLVSTAEVSRQQSTQQRQISATKALAVNSVLCTGAGEVVNGSTCATAGFTPPAPDALTADPDLPANTGILGAGGGLVPSSTAAPKTDGRGKLLLYCVADSSSLTGSTASIAGNPAYALISAGSDGVLDTSCADALADAPQNDDKVVRSLVSDALDYAGVWNRLSDTEVSFGAGAPSGARVGIGTNAPTEQLDVNGNAKISGDLSVGGTTSLSGAVQADTVSSTGDAIVGGNLGVSGAASANSMSLTNPLAVSDGGTGAATPSGARSNLGATATGDALFTAVDASGGRATLGLGTISTQDASAVAITGGSVTGITALDISDAGTDLEVADGGTGASNAATARSNIGADNATNLLSGTVDPNRLPTTTGDVSVTRTDVTTQDATVVGLQGRPVETTAPADGEGLGWDSGSSSWKPMVLGVPATGDTGAVSGQHDHDARYYTQTELNTSAAGGAVHWDNVTNKPTFSTSLASLTDTSLASLGDGQVLYYDAGTSSWKNGNVDGVPVGTVAAFDSATCPIGWSDFTPANGRFIVGVGASTDAGGHSATYGLGDSGGENRHRITEAEMPSHAHTTYQYDYGSGSGNGFNHWVAGMQTTRSGERVAKGDPSGSDVAHENRPPYVALRYCKKTVQTTAPLPNAPSVEGLSNTNVSGLQNGQALLWDAANLEWTNADIPSAPLGTVSAFNLATCPSGWRRFTEADGRFIVATGTSTAGGSQTYALGNSGGENAHQLTVAEMPSHRHEFPFDDRAALYGGTDTDFTPNIHIDASNGNGHLGRAKLQGGDTSHENRPPFYALTLCEKITAPLNPYAEQPWMMSGADTYFDGSVGIGTTSPSANIEILEDGGIASLRLTDEASSGRGGILKADGTNFSVMTTSSIRSLTFGIDGVEKARLHYNGEFLMGVASPLTNGQLQVSANGAKHGVYAETAGDGYSAFYGYASGSGPAIYGHQVGTGGDANSGVYGYSTNYWGIRGQSANSGYGGVLGYSGADTSYYGILGYQTYALYGSGNAYVTGSYTGSDRRLKENIADLADATDLLMQVRVREFDWKENTDARRSGLSHDYGVIAQEIEEVLPHVVKDTEAPLTEGRLSLNQEIGTFKTVEYSKLVPFLVKMNQEQQEAIEELQAGAPPQGNTAIILAFVSGGLASALAFSLALLVRARRRAAL